MFSTPADSYDQFMGRYSKVLAPLFADFAGVGSNERLLDVGCGPGALTSELVRRSPASLVAAVDPSPPFIAATGQRFPDVDVRLASAEDLPFEDSLFDVSLTQLVVHFMTDPAAGLREMGRVTRSGGLVAACVWDHAGGGGPLSLFWAAARSMDPGVHDESDLPGTRQGHLGELFAEAGLTDIFETPLDIAVEHHSFEEWWEPFTLGTGPAGVYTAALEPGRRHELREKCRVMLPPAPFEITARAWAARAHVA
jgi:SAM-dependent methyltransferase